MKSGPHQIVFPECLILPGSYHAVCTVYSQVTNILQCLFSKPLPSGLKPFACFGGQRDGDVGWLVDRHEKQPIAEREMLFRIPNFDLWITHSISVICS
jgi:hypothetical protein